MIFAINISRPRQCAHLAIPLLLLITIFLPQRVEALDCSLTLREKANISSSNYPLTFAHVFKAGDVQSGQGVALEVNGSILPTQFDIKRRFADSSVRHGVLSAIIPEIKAGQDLEVKLVVVDESVNHNSDEMNKPEILETDVQSVMHLSDVTGGGYSGNLSADLRSALQSQTNLNYWLKGGVVTEILVRQDLNNSLNAMWEVRIYDMGNSDPTDDHIRISNSVENVESHYRGNIHYSLDIYQGSGKPKLSYRKDGFSHNHNSRWRKILWQTEQPPEIEIRYDLKYLIESRHLLNYDQSLTIPESIISGAYSQWQALDNDIMGTGIITPYFPTTGGRQDIGILPAWAVRYLYSMDNRAREIMLNVAELSGGIPIHYRESDPGKKYYNHILSIDDRPTVWLGRNSYTWTKEQDRLPDPIGEESSPWTVDRAHQASFSYIPYMITGERFYLDELYYWAAYNLGACNYNSDYGRDYSKGLIRDQVRGEAWTFRTLVHAAALAPDQDQLEKDYFHNKVMNNIDVWNEELLSSDSHPLHTWGTVSCWPEDGGRPDESIIGCENPKTSVRTGSGSGVNETVHPVRSMTTHWQDDFVLASLTHGVELGYPALGLKKWLGEQIINRFTHPDVNPFHGANYRFPATYVENVNVGPQGQRMHIATWRQAMESLKYQPTAFSSTGNGGYCAIALGALALVAEQNVIQPFNGSTRIVTGTMALEWLKKQVFDPAVYAENPKYYFIPRKDQVPELKISTATLPSGQVGRKYYHKIGVVGGVQPYLFDITSGALPEGVQMTLDGVLGGTPERQETARFTVEVSDGEGKSTTADLEVIIGRATSILFLIQPQPSERVRRKN